MLRRRAARVTGYPPSANGASSFHLWWRLDASQRLVAAHATLEVVEAPRVDRLYFWAMQVGFHDGQRDRGAGHAGLQWLPSPAGPSLAAVNWGGYRSAGDGGGELDGSRSALPGTNANTRLYPWTPGRPYRLSVERSPGDSPAWRASITDLGRATTTVIRDLHAPGAWLTGPGVWSEVFARCDDPPVVVRWSDLRATTDTGRQTVPRGLTVTYQGEAEGGCDNTTVVPDGDGVLQMTATGRTVAHGSVLAW